MTWKAATRPFAGRGVTMPAWCAAVGRDAVAGAAPRRRPAPRRRCARARRPARAAPAAPAREARQHPARRPRRLVARVVRPCVTRARSPGSSPAPRSATAAKAAAIFCASGRVDGCRRTERPPSDRRGRRASRGPLSSAACERRRCRRIGLGHQRVDEERRLGDAVEVGRELGEIGVAVGRLRSGRLVGHPARRARRRCRRGRRARRPAPSAGPAASPPSAASRVGRRREAVGARLRSTARTRCGGSR